MISENEIIEYLEKEIPEFSIHENNSDKNVYTILNQFAMFTIRLIKNGNPVTLKKCFKSINMLVKDGDKVTRNAASNVFLFSISCCIVCQADQNQVLNLIGLPLRAEFNKLYYEKN